MLPQPRTACARLGQQQEGRNHGTNSTVTAGRPLSKRRCRVHNQKRGTVFGCLLGGSDWRRICRRRIVTYPAGVGHWAWSLLGLAVVEQRRVRLDDRGGGHSVDDPNANNQF